MKSVIVLAIATFLMPLSWPHMAWAADTPPADKTDASVGTADDEAAIRASGAKFVEAYNARDAKKLAQCGLPRRFTSIRSPAKKLSSRGHRANVCRRFRR